MDTKALESSRRPRGGNCRSRWRPGCDRVPETDSAELRGKADTLRELREQIAQSRKAVIDRVAYTWFNRFCALRFMDVNHYTRMGVVSPAEGFTQPEILQEAKQGVIDDDLARFVDRQRCPGPAERPAALPRPAGRGLPPAAGGRLQRLPPDDAVPVRADRRLHRAADARRPALGELGAAQTCAQALTDGGLPGCGGHRLAVPVLHLREQG